MKLTQLLEALPRYELRGEQDIDVRDIELDSRRVGGGELFVCLEGLARNGHDFAAAAVAKGASVLVVRHPVSEVGEATQVVVPDTREAMARIAAAFFSYPSRSLQVTGVTGTNGKTTVTHLLREVGKEAGKRAEVVGTLGSSVGGHYEGTGFTTPESPELQRLFREAVDRGTEWIALEVSSHALAQKRSYATDFAVVVFTNLTRDHLDYHQTMERYFDAKAELFTQEGRGSRGEAVAVINLEDPVGPRLARLASGKTVTYGFGDQATYRARDVRVGPRDTGYTLVTPGGENEVRLNLLGDFNVLNALAAQAAAMELGVPAEVAAAGVGKLNRISGRMEPVTGTQPFLVLVDYSHTPDALEHALGSSRAITRKRLIVVFGCGGDRDQGKRQEMGRVASEKADLVVVTSDNPRSEDPESIIDAVVAGTRGGSATIVREVDRRRAIGHALGLAEAGDTVLLAGKGHEPYQVIGDQTIPFDDRRVAADTLREIGFDADDAE